MTTGTALRIVGAPISQQDRLVAVAVEATQAYTGRGKQAKEGAGSFGVRKRSLVRREGLARCIWAPKSFRKA